MITPESMTIDLRSAFRSHVALELPPTAYAAHLGTDELLIRVDGARLGTANIDPLVYGAAYVMKF